MKQYQIEFNWIITDKRKSDLGSYMCGNTRLIVKAKNQIEAINDAISFCEMLPDWELERNNINIEIFKDGCKYYGKSQIEKITSVKIVK